MQPTQLSFLLIFLVELLPLQRLLSQAEVIFTHEHQKPSRESSDNYPQLCLQGLFTDAFRSRSAGPICTLTAGERGKGASRWRAEDSGPRCRECSVERLFAAAGRARRIRHFAGCLCVDAEITCVEQVQSIISRGKCNTWFKRKPCETATSACMQVSALET